MRPDVTSSTTSLLEDKDTSRWLRGAGLKQTASAESRPLLARSRALTSIRSSWGRAAASHLQAPHPSLAGPPWAHQVLWARERGQQGRVLLEVSVASHLPP